MRPFTVFPMMLIRAAGLPLARLNLLATNWQTVEEDILVGQKKLVESQMALQVAFDDVLAATMNFEMPWRTRIYNARKQFFQRQKLVVHPFLDEVKSGPEIHEVPALALAIEQYAQAREQVETARELYKNQVNVALTSAYRALQQIAAEENFQRALLFASHALLEQVPRFCQTSVEKFSKKERQTALSVLQYATRMAAKTSPLSRFTTVAFKNISAPGLERHDLQKSAVTPNVALLEAIYGVLLQEPAFYNSLSLILNPCIVSLQPERYTWLQYTGDDERFQEVETSPMLDFIVQFFLEHERRVRYSDLFVQLIAEVDAEQPELEQHIFQLVELGFLEWELPERGMTPAWCNNLYQYLGFLPGEQVIVDTAALVHWLRTAARTFQYLAPADAMHAQKEAWNQVQRFFQKYGGSGIPVPPEQLFFEDAEQHLELACPPDMLRELLDQLAECWATRQAKVKPGKRINLHLYLDKCCPKGQSIDFLTFCRGYLSEKGNNITPDFTPVTAESQGERTPAILAENIDGFGALLQVYSDKGNWYAVVNSLFPSGGKLFARWLSLFPAGFLDALQTWNNPTGNLGMRSEEKPFVQAPFPWQHWSNANFQPVLFPNLLAFPGSRLQPQTGTGLFYTGNLDIINDPDGPVLRDRPSGNHIRLHDLGLEAPEGRPPAVRTLWLAGVPYVSIDSLLPDDLWKPLYDDSILYRARYTYRQLVLARAAWAVTPRVWTSWLIPTHEFSDFFMHIRESLRAMGVPRHFFANFSGQKPQYFDVNSPVSIVLFHKTLEHGTGKLLITEMLPLPDQVIVENDGGRAAEFVVEIKTA